jgi:hypothetical protein
VHLLFVLAALTAPAPERRRWLLLCSGRRALGEHEGTDASTIES